jgi:hypothetical protein
MIHVTITTMIAVFVWGMFAGVLLARVLVGIDAKKRKAESSTTIIFECDGREVARSIVRRIPGEINRQTLH